MDACLGKIAELLVGGVINYVKRHRDYVIRYKNKVQLLEEENNQLGEQKDRIQRKVDRAENNGKDIETGVSSWLDKVEKTEGNIAKYLHQQQNRESFKCFKGCMCPNLMWRHKRGMEAEKRKSEVSELILRGERLETSPVARNASFQSQLLFDSPHYYTTFPSRASVFDKIMEALKDSGVNMIGVHGPGGAGKTTMVKEVANEAKKLGIFDNIVIAVVSKDPNTSKLQEDIAPQLDLKYEQTSELGRADELRKALLNGRRKILVILDDLWRELDLNAIGIPISSLGDKGCKILLTSRGVEVFRRMNIHSCFPIGYLEEQESWKLFTKVIGDFGVDESIARKVCKRCGGLPIAIVAVGAALKVKGEAEWRDALYQLENCPRKSIEEIDRVGYTPLKWSYDFLKEKDAKSCFLLCCLFPEDAEISIDDLVRYSFALGFLRKVYTLKVARNRVQAMVNMLKSSCLLLNGKNKNFIKMHDVIRDLAISITEEEQTEHGGGHDWPGQQQFIVDHNIRNWPENDAWKHHTAISLRINDDNIHFLCSVLHCPVLHTLVLKLGKSSLKIPNDFFQGMKEARVLDLEDILLDLPSLVLELNHLRMLRLNNCQLLGDLSTIRNLKNHIEILSFEGSMIEELPQEIGELTRLRSLDLRECKSLKVIPKGVISKLIYLEELYVTKSFKGWDNTLDGGGMSNASIAELELLTQLTVLHVSISAESSRIMVQKRPDLFEKLTNFVILIAFDYHATNRSPNVLEIDGIHHIDDEFHLLMDKVDDLRLSNIQDLRYLFHKPQQHFAPSGWGSFCKLTDLEISKCNSSKYLFSPSCARALQQLRTLRVRYCSGMEQIIGVGEHYNEEKTVTDEAIIFSRLEHLELRGLPQFRSFYPNIEKTTIEGNPSNWTTTAQFIFNEKVSFPVLEDLVIYKLSVECIWNKKAIQSPKGSDKVYFSQLKCMKVVECHNLVNVFPSSMLPRLQNLETLLVYDCPSLTLLVEDLNPNIQSSTVKFKSNDVFPKLRDLELCFLPKLMKIWLNDEDYCSYDDSVHLYLKSVSIQGCGSLRHAFSTLVARHLAHIQDLNIKACPRMEVIVAEARGEGETNNGTITFNELKGLWLADLPNLKSFYQSKSEASHLFNQVSFPILEELRIYKLPMEDIWNKQTIQSPKELDKVSFSQLKNVEIVKCHNLVNVFPSNMLPRLPNLETIRVRDCHSLTLLVEDLNPNIQRPTVKYKFIDVFPKLRDLELRFLPKLMKIWLNDEDYCSYDNSVHLYLKAISIMGCGSLRHAFSAFVARHLALIQHLSIKACPRMEVIVLETRGEGETDDGTITFRELKELCLKDLPNLRSFYESKSEAPHLFNYQDACPNMEALYLEDFKSIGEIQVWDLATTQEHLHNVSLIGCQVSTKVLSHNVKRSYRMIRLQNCQGFKHVIDLDDTISVGEKQFIDVERLKLYGLPELVSLWNKNLHKIGGLRNLKYINIKNCPQMNNLLTHSMATTLQHLTKIVVESCEMMEEIIIIEENNINISWEEKATWQIEFSKLEYLILIDLPNLKTFCNDEKGSFSFSSLRGVRVENCPKMKTFVSGQICLPPSMMLAGVGFEVEITNLNAYFEARNEDSNHLSKIIRWRDHFDYFYELYNTEVFFDTEETVTHIFSGDNFDNHGYESEYYIDD